MQTWKHLLESFSSKPGFNSFEDKDLFLMGLLWEESCGLYWEKKNRHRLSLLYKIKGPVSPNDIQVYELASDPRQKDI